MVEEQSGPRDYDALEKPNPMLLAIGHFKPEETEPILPGVKEMILATPH